MHNKNVQPLSKVNAILHFKCPHCRSGNIFKHAVYHPLKFADAYEHCPVCHYKFEKETGYYWGAMYISYGFSAGLMLLLGLIAINLELSFNYIYIIVFPLVLILSPFSFRYSRMVLLYYLGKVDFDPEAWKKKD